jgi:xylose dehydrogenase (NAD/NADP)
MRSLEAGKHVLCEKPLSRRADDTRFDPELDGGALMDVGCYCISAIRFAGGEPERMQAEQVLGESGVDVVFAATLRLAGDTLAHFDCGFVLPSRDEVEIVGEQASLFLDDPWHARSPVIELRRDGEVERIEAGRANSYRLELENVCDAIRGEGELLLGRDDAVGQARAIEALYEAASEAA